MVTQEGRDIYMAELGPCSLNHHEERGWEIANSGIRSGRAVSDQEDRCEMTGAAQRGVDSGAAEKDFRSLESPIGRSESYSAICRHT